MMHMVHSSTDILYILGMYETMCLQSGSNDNHRWFMEGNRLRFKFGKNLEGGDRQVVQPLRLNYVQYHYA